MPIGREPLRLLYLTAGLACVGLGVLGMFLPVLPTTPFLLLAVWAFARSSRRLESWLLEHPRFGPRLRAFRTDRVVPVSVKLTAWGWMAFSLGAMIVSGRVPWPGVALTAGLMGWGVYYLARCPSRPPP